MIKKNLKYSFIFFSIWFSFALLMGNTAIASNSLPEKALTILYTNDIHGHLLPFDYDTYGKPANNVGGAARRAALIRSIKQNTKNTVLVMDAGDVFTRGKWSHYLGEPDIEVMNMIGYDAMAIGNNEFKATEGINSQEILRGLIKKAKFPMLCANVKDGNQKLISKPYVILNRDGVRIAIFSVTAKRSETYPQTKGWTFEDPIETAKRTIDEIKGKYDLLIALTHIGYAWDAMMALSLPEIDLIVGGDSHTWVDKPTLFASPKRSYSPWEAGGVVVVQDGEYGKSLGRIDLTIKKDTNNRYRIKSYSGKLIDLDSSIAPANDINTVLKRYRIGL